ncbi:OLC1v1008590C3 [Oldenlandia corymbosa var. corymbosa]|nr:OLC1v1008590C3 [Oldenlandia corymbosa var. corymbosa]
MSGSVMPNLERKSSIENEPRTLNLSQIQIAREAALYVVSTRSMEEALRIFTAGLKPVINSARDSEEEEENKNMVYDFEGFENSESRIRDIVSAPF